MKLTIVIGVLDAFEISAAALATLIKNLHRPKTTEVIVIDNGSTSRFYDYLKATDIENETLHLGGFRVLRNEKNVGNYPLFKQGLEESRGEIIAFVHSDVFIYESGWDVKTVAQFDANKDLGLVGFIGSTELDNWGGRGTGTHSNMQGNSIAHTHDDGTWTGSRAEVHGKRDEGFVIDGSVVDGCVMIFRRDTLKALEHKPDFPIHHHYDRLLSAQTLELGQRVAILGIAFDHISGQTANHAQTYQDTARDWFKERHGIDAPDQWAALRKDWLPRTDNPSRGTTPNQWDHATYLEAEYQFLKEYRDQKHVVPAVYGKPVNR